jgi:hypothetical protein
VPPAPLSRDAAPAALSVCWASFVGSVHVLSFMSMLHQKGTPYSEDKCMIHGDTRVA